MSRTLIWLAGYSHTLERTKTMKRLSNMGVVCGLLLLALLLAACGGGDTNSSATNTVPNDTSTPANNLSKPLPAIAATGNFREYALPQSDSGMMRPAIDHEGRVWFGEMNQNYLAVFDPRTQHFQQMVPPRGRGGIMAGGPVTGSGGGDTV